jgi:heme/copper-type cytochrome/quinol oxidase subunit 2
MPAASIDELLLIIFLTVIPVIIIALIAILIYKHFTKNRNNTD